MLYYYDGQSPLTKVPAYVFDNTRQAVLEHVLSLFIDYCHSDMFSYYVLYSNTTAKPSGYLLYHQVQRSEHFTCSSPSVFVIYGSQERRGSVRIT